MEKRFIKPEGLPDVPVYTQVVAVTGGKTIYVSGQVSVNAENETLNKGDVREQARQALENLKTALAAAGATFADIVKLTILVKGFNPETHPSIVEVLSQHLPPENPPAATFINVAGLYSDDYLIEIEAVAVVD
jgi:enamine deaminase RidA (YjgF/YER057c/UK114 family)